MGQDLNEGMMELLTSLVAAKGAKGFSYTIEAK